MADDRTTDVGLYHFALSYRHAADELARRPAKGTHPHAPIRSLYHHSIELFLKAYLRLYGAEVAELEKIGHRFGPLLARCRSAGLTPDDEDVEVINMLGCSDAWTRARYIETGKFHWPTVEALARTAKSLAGLSRAAFKAAGKPVR